METQHAPPVDGGREAPARRPVRRRRRILTVAALTGLALFLVAAAGALAVYHRLESNIRTDHVEDALSPDRPAAAGGGRNRALNVLVIGSDSRAGANRRLGGGSEVAGERSDTTLLLHLAAGRRKAVALSIPRDLLVTVPRCLRRDGVWEPEQPRRMFNSAFERGGAACARNTVERLTGLRVDHHLVVDFSGFRQMVDAVGGVEICLPEAVRDDIGRISLDAGRRTVGGREALDYVRLRHDESAGGTGSDLGRIRRQQAFVSSLVRQVSGARVLANPARLYQLADAATRSVRADEGLASVRDLVELARTLQGLGPSDLTFVTVPAEDSPTERYRLEPLQPDARLVFEAIGADRSPLDVRRPEPTGRITRPPAGSGAPSGTPGPGGRSGPAITAPAPSLRVETRGGDQDICGVS